MFSSSIKDAILIMFSAIAYRYLRKVMIHSAAGFRRHRSLRLVLSSELICCSMKPTSIFAAVKQNEHFYDNFKRDCWLFFKNYFCFHAASLPPVISQIIISQVNDAEFGSGGEEDQVLFAHVHQKQTQSLESKEWNHSKVYQEFVYSKCETVILVSLKSSFFFEINISFV